MRLLTLNSITYAVPVEGAEKVEVKHNGRKLMIDAFDHVRVAADVVHDFPKEFAAELLKARQARRPDPVLDDVGDDATEAVAAAAAVAVAAAPGPGGKRSKADPLA